MLQGLITAARQQSSPAHWDKSFNPRLYSAPAQSQLRDGGRHHRRLQQVHLLLLADHHRRLVLRSRGAVAVRQLPAQQCNGQMGAFEGERSRTAGSDSLYLSLGPA